MIKQLIFEINLYDGYEFTCTIGRAANLDIALKYAEAYGKKLIDTDKKDLMEFIRDIDEAAKELDVVGPLELQKDETILIDGMLKTGVWYYIDVGAFVSNGRVVSSILDYTYLPNNSYIKFSSLELGKLEFETQDSSGGYRCQLAQLENSDGFKCELLNGDGSTRYMFEHDILKHILKIDEVVYFIAETENDIQEIINNRVVL